MSTRHRGFRDRLHELTHGHHHAAEDPYDPQNWPVSAEPFGGSRPFPIPPTPTDSSASASAGEEGRRRRHRSSRRKKKKERERSELARDRPVIDAEGDREEAERRRSVSIPAPPRHRRPGSSEEETEDVRGLQGGGVALDAGGDVAAAATSSSSRHVHKASRPPPSSALSAPAIVHTPATPQPEDAAIAKELRRKKRRSTQPLPVSTAVPRSLAEHGHGHSRSGSYPERGYHHHNEYADMPPAPGDYAIDDTPRALAYPARQRQAVEPPYPATPPPLASVQPEGAEYAPPPQRLPTILRAGGAHPHRHPQGPEVQPPPPLVQGAVEIGEGRELQRAEAGRRLFRSRSKTTPGSEPPSRKNSVPTDPALPPASPSSPTPSSYRNSIYSTISSLTRSLSKSLASSPASKRPTHTHSQRTENGFAILKTFDTVFLVDDSPSMLYQSRWADTFEALISISEIATQYDTDGIDIHFLNAPEHDTLGVKSPEHVREIFSRVHPVSGGSTPMGARLDELLRNYIDRYRRAREEALAAITPPVNTSGEGQQQQQQTPIIGPPRLSNLIKPLNIVVITDGDATDDPESVIVSAARELERLNAPLTQVGIQMFQVGGDPEAAEFLRGLDDDLVEVYGIRDMVDTTPYHGGGGGGGGGGGDGEEGCFTGEEMLKVLVGAVNRRVDRRENRGVGGGGGGDGGFSFAGVM